MYIDDSQFSERENEVIELLLQGKSNKQIALSLGISASTVEYHLKNVYKKLQVNSRTEAVLRLGKSIGNDTSGELGKSTVEINGEPADNGGKSISTRRIPMNKMFYIVGGGLLTTTLVVILWLINMPAQNAEVMPMAQASETPITVTPTIISSSTLSLTEQLAIEPTPYVGSLTFVTEKAANIGDKVATLKGAEISPTISIITFCVFSPDKQQWIPNVSLLYKGVVFNPSGFAVTNGKTTLGENVCYRLEYDLQFDVTDDPKQSIAIWVNGLTKDQPERLPDELISSAFQKLSAKGIEFVYLFEENGVSIEITKKPAELTEDEVTIMIQNALTEEALTSGVLIFDLK
jgi:DNA-binding CsgD family transcriptional regulator